jgi:hypothetical protein
MSSPAPKQQSFSLVFATRMRLNARMLFVASGVYFGFMVASIATTLADFKDPPAWTKLLPCSFQTEDVDDLFDNFRSSKIAEQLAALVPSCLVFFRLLWGALSGELSGAGQIRIPLRTFGLAWLWRALFPIILYSTNNSKLAMPYKLVTRKTCEVVLSLTFTPPGHDVDITRTQFEMLRNVTAEYFAEPLNHLWVDKYPTLEGKLAGVNQVMTTLQKDDLSCEVTQANDNPVYRALETFVQPSQAIKDYCFEASEIVSADGRRPEWPIAVFIDHLANIVSGLVIGEETCIAPTATSTTSSVLTTKDVCDTFSTASTWAEVPSSVRPFLSHVSGAKNGGSNEYVRYANHIRNLPTEFDKQAACIFVAFIDDPAEGRDAISSFCPQILPFKSQAVSEEQLDEFKQRSLSLGLPKSLSFPGLTPTNYSAIRASLFAHGVNVTDDLYKRFAQWYDNNPVSMVQRAARQVSTDLAAIGQGLGLEMSDLATIQSSEATHISSQLAPVVAWVRDDMAEIRNVTADMTYDPGYSGNSYEDLLAATDNVLLEKQGLAAQDIQAAIDAVEGMKSVADDITAVTQFTQQVIVDPGIRIHRITRASTLRAIGEVAERLSAAAAAAEQAMFNAVGLFSGLKSAQKIFPFAISVLTGTINGLEEYRSLALSTKFLTDSHDVRILHIWTRMLILVCVSTLVVPLMAAPIFVYQFIATYAFAMVIAGLLLVLGGTAASAFQGETSEQKMSIVKMGAGTRRFQLAVFTGYALILGGVAVELATSSVGEALRKMLTPLLGVSLLLGMVFSMFLTKIVTLSIAAKSSEFFFKQFADVYYASADNGERVPSQLSKMTVDRSEADIAAIQIATV